VRCRVPDCAPFIYSCFIFPVCAQRINEQPKYWRGLQALGSLVASHEFQGSDRIAPVDNSAHGILRKDAVF
jgi:hypothetical protein